MCSEFRPQITHLPAILADGSVVAWGGRGFGGDCSAVQDQLRNVQQIQATAWAFCCDLGRWIRCFLGPPRQWWWVFGSWGEIPVSVDICNVGQCIVYLVSGVGNSDRPLERAAFCAASEAVLEIFLFLLSSVLTMWPCVLPHHPLFYFKRMNFWTYCCIRDVSNVMSAWCSDMFCDTR